MTKLAIIGGGQLGLLLCQAARTLGIHTLVVIPDETVPAFGEADESIVNDLGESGLAAKIAERADIVTFEFEAVPDLLLDELEAAEQAGDLVVHPSVATLRLLKNKATQKSWYAEQGVPTMPFSIENDPSANFASLVEEFGLPFVQKAQTGGYDGYGVQIVPADADADTLWGVPSIIERYMDRPTELGVVVARSQDGATQAYPPVRMAFDHELNILDAVVQPTGLSQQLDAEAESLASRVIGQLGAVGVFAVEMFVDENGGLLVNEISPRVHNSGHVTLDSDAVSQFEQHVRAVCGLPLKAANQTPPAAVMRNLLYSDKLAGVLSQAKGPFRFEQDGSALYWYGKHEGRDGRKMGHVTVVNANLEDSVEVTKQLIDALVSQGAGEGS